MPLRTIFKSIRRHFVSTDKCPELCIVKIVKYETDIFSLQNDLHFNDPRLGFMRGGGQCCKTLGG